LRDIARDNTLGVMGTARSKITLAREQLEDGIALFLAGRYVSALTLLGAAEEVLARVIEAKHGSHPLEADWQMANQIRTHLRKPHISKQQFFRVFNEGRNRVKHHTPGASLRVNHDRFGEAFMLIQRATGCADLLRLRYQGRLEYRAWHEQAGFGQVPARR
jgi:hypothetical protein